MKLFNILIVCALVLVLASPVAAAKGPPTKVTASNNLSYPVIWAEGVTKTLPGTPQMTPLLGGAWWYQWGTNGVDPNVVPASCQPDPDDNAYCNDGIPLHVDTALVPGSPPADNPLPLAKAYLQKDAKNVWQAQTADWSADPVNVHWIDWGDNLESQDWYLTSQVRTEVVLFEDLAQAGVPDLPWLEYEMRHVSGWGIDEVHGMAVDASGPVSGLGTSATIYSPCARFTIQKLRVQRDDPGLTDLVWVPQQGWSEPEGSTIDLINDTPLFNKAVYEGGDGPGYYSAEINVKGRIIYGYTWSVAKANEGAGDYRFTFSFDQTCGSANLNTNFVEGTTGILVPLETEVVAEAETGGGATAVLDFAENLTYMDVRILQRGGGGGGRPRLEQERERTRYCQDHPGECCTDGSVCLSVRERTGEIAQLQAQIECGDDVCQQFQTQLGELVQILEQLQLRTCAADGECVCTCEAGDDCLLLRDRIRDVDRLRDQLRDLSCESCTDNDCPCDIELLDALDAALVDLNQSLASPQNSFFMFLPALMDSGQ